MENTIKTLLILILLFILPCPYAFANDKLEHFGISSIFGAVSETYFHYKTDYEAGGRIIGGTIFGTIPGLVKEIIDSTQEDNCFSGKDMAANIAGAFAGSVIANLINTEIEIHLDKRKHRATISFLYRF
ncbi:lipoprotein [bacterium BMS3Abin07]|nr:lipoprotein [bacterium BMS3Abin07]GBE32883.1 lipoprotein [bacterium BMS3Bbin05]HDO21491.1 hypothetical protein [Nitrospirota bacterium]